MKVVLKDTERAARPFDVDVKVDRGSATYAHSLPEKDASGFLGDAFKGFGEEQSAGSGSSYVEVSAVPSATVTVEQGGEEVGSARWGEVAESGRVDTPGVRFELIDPGRNWVNVTVLDDDTGRARAVQGPLPVAGWGAVPAPRLPQPGQLEPEYVAHRRRRRCAPGPDHLCLHRRRLRGVAAARGGYRRRRSGLRVRAAEEDCQHQAGAARADAAHQALEPPERQGLVQRRLARPLPVAPRGAPRVPVRRPERRESAPVSVGQPVHEHGGLHRVGQRLARGRQHRLRGAGRTASTSWGT